MRRLKAYSAGLFLFSLTPSLIYLEIVRDISSIDLVVSMIIPCITLLFIYIVFTQI